MSKGKKTRVKEDYGHLTRSFLAYRDNKSEREFSNFFEGTKNYLYSTLKNKGYYNDTNSVLVNEFEDLYHECIIKVLKDPSKFDPTKASIVTYVFNIFVNRLIDRFRHEQVVIKVKNLINDRIDEINRYEENL